MGWSYNQFVDEIQQQSVTQTKGDQRKTTSDSGIRINGKVATQDARELSGPGEWKNILGCSCNMAPRIWESGLDRQLENHMSAESFGSREALGRWSVPFILPT